jgi:hypothetical protein
MVNYGYYSVDFQLFKEAVYLALLPVTQEINMPTSETIENKKEKAKNKKK